MFISVIYGRLLTLEQTMTFIVLIGFVFLQTIEHVMNHFSVAITTIAFQDDGIVIMTMIVGMDQMNWTVVCV